MRMMLLDEEPEVYEAISRLDKQSAGIDERLRELVKIRASQINGCAFCIDMHTRSARALGETEERIYALNAWRETPFFTPAERAALALTEAVTLVAGTGVPDEMYEEARRFFDSRQLAKILVAIVTINACNRIAIATRMAPEVQNVGNGGHVKEDHDDA